MQIELPDMVGHMNQVSRVLMDKLVDVESTLVPDVVVSNIPGVMMDSLGDHKAIYRERGILLSAIGRDMVRATFIWNKEIP